MSMSSTVSLFTMRVLTVIRYVVAYKKYKKLKKIQGDWDYECILLKPYQFPEGGNSHGGTCSIEFKYTLLSTQVLVKGTRVWAGTFNHTNGKKTRNPLPLSRTWKSEVGAFLSDTEIIYKYNVDPGPIEGITSLDIIEDGTLKLEGNFYYIPDDKEIKRGADAFRTVLMSKTEQIGGISLKAYGKIYLTKQ